MCFFLHFYLCWKSGTEETNYGVECFFFLRNHENYCKLSPMVCFLPCYSHKQYKKMQLNTMDRSSQTRHKCSIRRMNVDFKICTVYNYKICQKFVPLIFFAKFSKKSKFFSVKSGTCFFFNFSNCYFFLGYFGSITRAKCVFCVLLTDSATGLNQICC